MTTNLESTRAIYTLKISQPEQGSRISSTKMSDAAGADMSHGEWGERCNLPAISAPLTPFLRTDRPLLPCTSVPEKNIFWYIHSSLRVNGRIATFQPLDSPYLPR
jgi:hypothetical protein